MLHADVGDPPEHPSPGSGDPHPFQQEPHTAPGLSGYEVTQNSDAPRGPTPGLALSHSPASPAQPHIPRPWSRPRAFRITVCVPVPPSCPPCFLPAPSCPEASPARPDQTHSCLSRLCACPLVMRVGLSQVLLFCTSRKEAPECRLIAARPHISTSLHHPLLLALGLRAVWVLLLTSGFSSYAPSFCPLHSGTAASSTS